MSAIPKDKAFTLIGMSGVGKSHLACKLAEWGWYNYSCDYLIGTKYLADQLSGGEITEENIERLSDFVGQIGSPEEGGVGLEEFRKRQQMYYEAECNVLRDMGEGLDRAAKEGRDFFVNDSSGSLCEVEDKDVLEAVGAQSVFVYLKVDEADHPKILERAIRYPKPLFFPPAFFDAHLEKYMGEVGMETPEDINPARFLSWVFPHLFESRLPKYQALADKYGVTIPAAEAGNISSPDDFLHLVHEKMAA